MKVREAVRRPVKSCTPLSSLEDVARLMWEGDHSAVPVVDPHGKAVGLLSDREIAVALAAKNRGASHVLVRELLGEDFVTCTPDDDLAVAAQKMREHRLRSLAIIEPDRSLFGVLSVEDLAHAAKVSDAQASPAISYEEVVQVLKAVGRTREEAGENAPRWPWIHAGAR